MQKCTGYWNVKYTKIDLVSMENVDVTITGGPDIRQYPDYDYVGHIPDINNKHDYFEGINMENTRELNLLKFMQYYPILANLNI